eukprot:3214239-Alexandrium_andersonii.AAC.1
MRVARAIAQPSFDLAEQLLAHELLDLAQVLVAPRESRVVAAHDAPHVEPCTVETAGARLPPGEPEALKRR